MPSNQAGKRLPKKSGRFFYLRFAAHNAKIIVIHNGFHERRQGANIRSSRRQQLIAPLLLVRRCALAEVIGHGRRRARLRRKGDINPAQRADNVLRHFPVGNVEIFQVFRQIVVYAYRIGQIRIAVGAEDHISRVGKRA